MLLTLIFALTLVHTCAGSLVELLPDGPLKTPVRTSTDTQGGPARFAPRTSAAGLSPTCNVLALSGYSI